MQRQNFYNDDQTKMMRDEEEGGKESAVRDIIKDSFTEIVTDLGPRTQIKDRIKLFLKGAILFIIGLIVHRWALISSPVHPITTLAGAWKELLHPTAVPELFMFGVVLFCENTLLFIGYFVYGVGLDFRSKRLKRGAPLPPGFWRFYILEIFGTFLIPIGLLGSMFSEHGLMTWIIGWIDLFLVMIALLRMVGIAIQLLPAILRKM